MNVGLREARDLAQLLEGILVKQASPSTLERYAREREREWEKLLNVAGELQATDRAIPFVRDNAERLLACFPASGADLEALLDQVGLRMNGMVAA